MTLKLQDILKAYELKFDLGHILKWFKLGSNNKKRKLHMLKHKKLLKS